MRPVRVRVGDRFGQLTVMEVGYTLSECRASLCECDCGVQKIIANPKLVSKHTKSCGCIRGINQKHGYRWTKTYAVWSNMKQRCTNPTRVDYKYYGGKGITICTRWKDFSNFILDMGEVPNGLTLDRINPNGNYEPNNCRWATWAVQNQNKSTNKQTTQKNGEIT